MKNNSAKKSFFYFIFLFFISVASSAQNNLPNTKVEIIEANNIKELIEKQPEINSKSTIKGYRIKIHFGADKAVSKEVKAKFLAKFPDIEAYERYDQPNFNIRVGNFKTKLDAYKLLKEIQLEFPGAFIVQDDIEL